MNPIKSIKISGAGVDCNKCHKCKFVGPTHVPNNSHYRCDHPDIGHFEVHASERGIDNGWFMWPGCFDPIWLVKCPAFKSKGGE